MQRSALLPHLLLLLSGILVMAGCASSAVGSSQPAPISSVRASPPLVPTQSSSPRVQPTPGPLKQLKANGPIPSSCPVTPVNLGGPNSFAQTPWVQAQPASSDIVGLLGYAADGTQETYRLLPKGGQFADGINTKVWWNIASPGASNEFLLDGTLLTDPRTTFHDTGSEVWSSDAPQGKNFTSYIVAPKGGCWLVQLSSGRLRGSIVVWVVG